MTISDSDFTFWMEKRMNSTQTRVVASAATLPVLDGFYLHDKTYVNSNTKYTLLHRDSYEKHGHAGDAGDQRILREKVFETKTLGHAIFKIFPCSDHGNDGVANSSFNKTKNKKTKNTLFGPLSGSSMQLQREHSTRVCSMTSMARTLRKRSVRILTTAGTKRQKT